MVKKEKTDGMSRRRFFKGAALAGGIVAGSGLVGGLALAAPARTDGVPRKWDRETDVLVIGTGFAGLAAAIEAHDAGAKVLIIEKMPIIGGNSIIAGGGLNAVDPVRQAKDNLEDSIDTHYQQTLEGGDFRGDPVRVRALVENALAQVEWCEKEGIKWLDRTIMNTGALFPRGHLPVFPAEQGKGIILGLATRVKDRGIPILMEHKVTRIIRRGFLAGDILGLEVERKGKKMAFKARRGVVLASGGFGHDYKLLGIHNPMITKEVPSSNHPGATGEILMQAQDVGAYLVGMDFIQIHPSLGAPKPGRFSTDARYYCMVNTEGKRFIREDGRRDVQVAAIFKQPGKYFWMIWDDWGRKDLRVKDEVIEKNVKAGNIFRGNTLRELAEQIKVPGENLENTVARYNKLVEQGKDDDFGKDKYNLPYKLQVAPFYAHMNKPAIHHCMGGILTDVKSQVVGRDYEPIPRLYAGGEVTGGIQGANRLGGNATPDCLFYGRVAGKNAAAQKPWDGKKA